MTRHEERQQYAGYLLRRSIAEFGPKSDAAKAAAIEFCYLHNIDPHWRHMLQPKLDPSPQPPLSKPLDVDEYSVTQWQQVIAQHST